MPTYEYRCPDGHEFEHFVQKISLAVSELPCPVCGKAAARRISAGGGFVFKGSGFYITDYGKDGKKDQRDQAEKTEKATAAKAEKADSAGKGDATSGSGGGAAPAAGTAGSGDAPVAKPIQGDKVDKAPKKEPAPVAAPNPKKPGGSD